MSRNKKVFILLHLCLACIYLCWLLIQPYVEEIISYKSQISLYEAVYSKNLLFTQMLTADQELILEGYQELLLHKTSFWKKLGHAFWAETPPFALAWLFFSLAIPMLLLFCIEGAALSAWILPCIVVGYGYFLTELAVQYSDGLFPKEQYVLDTYVTQDEQTSKNKRDQLLLGWHRYLIHEWAHAIPLSDPSLRQEQLDQGLFAFNVARLKWIAQGKGDEVVHAGFRASPSLLRIGCYFIWNCLFACFVNRKECQSPA